MHVFFSRSARNSALPSSNSRGANSAERMILSSAELKFTRSCKRGRRSYAVNYYSPRRSIQGYPLFLKSLIQVHSISGGYLYGIFQIIRWLYVCTHPVDRIYYFGKNVHFNAHNIIIIK